MKKILLVDDEESFCYFVKKNLELTGEFKVFTANNGEEGLEIARKERPDLILLDIFMPGMSGSEVAAKLQEDAFLSQIPVAFLTAMAQKEEVEDGLIKKKSERLFLAKPITPEELATAIKKILERREVDFKK